MYKNMVGFSNVTGNMVLTGCSTTRSYKRLEMIWKETHYHKQKDIEILQGGKFGFTSHNTFEK